MLDEISQSADKCRALVLGVTGMLGHVLYDQLGLYGHEVFGTARSIGRASDTFRQQPVTHVFQGIEASDPDAILGVLAEVQPQVVINCIGVIKQVPAAKDPVTSISLNALFPHRLALFCRAVGARLIHISTDCIFSGRKGNYLESDSPDADDLYGRSKLLGEVIDAHCLTLRTSIIGHELQSSFGLLEWFLAQQGTTKGFTQAIFSGFPTVELARIIAEYVIPNPSLNGLYQVSSNPISKYDLLQIVARCYGKEIHIEPDDSVKIDRSLNSDHFRKDTGYHPPPWEKLVEEMHEHFMKADYYRNPQL